MFTFPQEFARFLMVRKKFWLLPVFAVMFVIAFLLLLAKTSAIAPFVYTLF